MNTQHFVWIMAQGPPCEEVIMFKSNLFWRTVCLIIAISVLSKGRLYLLSFRAGSINLLRVSGGSLNILQINGVDKDGSQIIIPVENKNVLPGSRGEGGWKLWKLDLVVHITHNGLGR